VDAAAALADLTEISSQIRSAALFDEGGGVAASTFADEERAHEFVRRARELLERASSVRDGGPALDQLEVATAEGSVFVVRGEGRLIAATTSPEPTVGLVFYDLKSCLRAAATAKAEAPAAKTRAAETEEDGA
jgi:predicted regulator of Ras-like GTPase activity (Roadblock/LC7/MglB family)